MNGRVYLDASVVVSIVTADAFSARAKAFLLLVRPTILVSDFAALGSAAVIAKFRRTRLLSDGVAGDAIVALDRFVETLAERVGVEAGDISTASRFVRRIDFNLRAPDAIHLAIAKRLSVQLATFDVRMAACAAALGIPLAPA